MTPDPYDTNIDLTILEALFNAGSYLMSHSTLLNHVRISATPRPAASEISGRIRHLDSKGLVHTSRSAMGVKYKLTDEGKAFWEEHGA